MKKFSFHLLLLSLVVFAGCKADQARKESSPTQVEEKAPDMHNAENALDYPGIYEGVIPAASGPGIKVTLTLNKDKTFEMISDYIDEKDAVFTEKGDYVIQGNMITLNLKNDAPRYLKVEEGRVRFLDSDKQPVTGALADHYILKQIKVF